MNLSSFARLVYSGLIIILTVGSSAALDTYQNFSKKMVIDRIIHENDLNGPELVGFGDGFVEIENTKSVGGIAVGMPTFEADPFIGTNGKRSDCVRQALIF